MARAGKIAISGGVGLRPYVPCGVSIRLLRRYAKPRVAIPSCQEAKRLGENLRSIFKTYALDCANPAPTATDRRKTLGRVKSSHLIAAPSRRNAYALLDALETRDYDALGTAYQALTANGHEPQRLKRRLRHWGYHRARRQPGNHSGGVRAGQSQRRGAGPHEREGSVLRVPRPSAGAPGSRFGSCLGKSDRQNGGTLFELQRRAGGEKEPVRRLALRNACAYGASPAVTLERYRYSSAG
jgi:hypothetical protein